LPTPKPGFESRSAHSGLRNFLKKSEADFQKPGPAAERMSTIHCLPLPGQCCVRDTCRRFFRQIYTGMPGTTGPDECTGRITRRPRHGRTDPLCKGRLRTAVRRRTQRYCGRVWQGSRQHGVLGFPAGEGP